MNIYGGLFLENLLAQDRYFDLQAGLFNQGAIQGIQLRVAHPSFTPTLYAEELPEILERLPSGMKLFIHAGAENVGVDFGQNLDECGAFARRGLPANISWLDWNKQTLVWSQEVALAAGLTRPWGVVHPGYGASINDWSARQSVVETLKTLPAHSVALENVPPIVDRDYAKAGWPLDRYWGFGGTPDDMEEQLLWGAEGSVCLIDFTHLAVMVNQAKAGMQPGLGRWTDLESAVGGFLRLPHCGICHFSGTPPAEVLMDSHDYFSAPLPSPLRDGLNETDAVCLEIKFDSIEESLRQIENFQEQL